MHDWSLVCSCTCILIVKIFSMFCYSGIKRCLAPSLCIPMNSDKTDRLDNDASLNAEKSRTAREIVCPGGQYPHSGFCCLNCPAGTYVKEKCTTAGSSSQCAACTFGTDYTEHGSGLERCLQCTRCRSDQEEAVPCTGTQNRLCRCKSGTHYCPPEEPCEVCKRCSKCLEGTVVRSCNATANAVCAPRDSPPAGTESGFSASTITLAVVLPLIVLPLAVIGLILRKKQRCGLISERPSEPSVNILIPTGIASTSSPEEIQNHNNESQIQESALLLQTGGQDNDDWGLGDSLSNTAASSENNLSSSPYRSTPPQRESPQSERACPTSGATLKDTSELYSLIPLQDNALLACLDEFYKVPFKSRNRLMRKAGLPNNKIETAKQNHPHNVEEQFHEMLLSWHEEQGQAADINTLLRALLHLDHRLSVEEITAEVIKNKFYTKSSSHLL
ncbi:tumor necrosis factor receptor superfamily member 6-like isoform X1 [Polyodon spathula]|uniref:tumor necrosis factor receptor superfamily member 6-like isoform X1 n=2 Tax=Polyodon spathula TaxID=7913 RepID=UPI001B7E79EB|nr:tumor necrosis factor receptor superfamily member 6-like isoform X1 [Polyodon spathula]